MRHTGVLVFSMILASCTGARDSETIQTVSSAVYVQSYIFDSPTCYSTGITQCNGMHCCPVGYAITGIHRDLNKLECGLLSGANATTEAGCFVSGTTSHATFEGHDIQVCPWLYYMKGVHFNNQQFTCCPYPESNQPINPVTLDGNGEGPYQTYDPQLRTSGGGCFGGTMHGCPGNNEVVIGVKMDSSTNWLACES